MSEQLEKILQSSGYIKDKFPKDFKPEIALIMESGSGVPDGFKIIFEMEFETPGQITGSTMQFGMGQGMHVEMHEYIFGPKKEKLKFQFAKVKEADVLIYKGRQHFYDGTAMRDIGHAIYVLKYLGIKKIISVDEVAHLNPRFNCGDLALVYDHINLIGDNPLIGKNENELGLRFPDMSNAYDRNLYQKVYEVFQENKFRIND